VKPDIESPTVAIKESAQVKVSAVWLALLRHLTVIANDERSEVRNTAVRTILSIFDHYGELLSSSAWSLLIGAVIFKLIDSYIEAQRRTRFSQDADEDLIQSWDGSSKLILDGFAALFAGFLETITKNPDFSHRWQTLMAYFEFYLSFHSQTLNASVFRALATIMSKAEDAAVLGKPALNRVGTIWAGGIPVGSKKNNAEGKQEAFLAYISALRELYRLTESFITADQISAIAENLQKCVRESDGLSYSADADYLTPLQKEILEVMQRLRSDLEGSPSTILDALAEFVSMPFEKDKADAYSTSLSFVAFSKAAMSVLGDFVSQQASKGELYSGEAILNALDSLALPISLKYKWQLEGSKPPPPWQLATTTALRVLRIAVPKSKDFELAEALREILSRAVYIEDHIARADLSNVTSRKKVQQDVEFDMEQFISLHNLLITYLEDPIIPSSLRTTYAFNFFNNSIIHEPEPEERPSEQAILDNLHTIRFGRTSDPMPSPRRKMSYLVLNFLLDQVRTPDSSTAPPLQQAAPVNPNPTPTPNPLTLLAQAAAPTLLLRAALPIKTYIADQPLRGRMPQPESQRQELLFVLRALRTLDTIPDAMGAAAAAAADGDAVQRSAPAPAPAGIRPTKRHLLILYPLVVKALGVAGGVPGGADAEVVRELRAWLHEVGVAMGAVF
jgi:hypothetical protein